MLWFKIPVLVATDTTVSCPEVCLKIPMCCAAEITKTISQTAVAGFLNCHSSTMAM